MVNALIHVQVFNHVEFFNSSIQLQWNMVGMEKRQLIVVRMHNT